MVKQSSPKSIHVEPTREHGGTEEVGGLSAEMRIVPEALVCKVGFDIIATYFRMKVNWMIGYWFSNDIAIGKYGNNVISYVNGTRYSGYYLQSCAKVAASYNGFCKLHIINRWFTNKYRYLFRIRAAVVCLPSPYRSL